MTQQTSRMRLAVINLLILSMLATLVARLWFLQVLAGPEIQAQATRTTVRLVYQQAPRGIVFDRKGVPLARNRTALTVAVDLSQLPLSQRDIVLPKLATVLGLTEADVRKAVSSSRYDQYTPRPVALDVPKDTVIYLLEHADEFPGIVAVEIPVREYPFGQLAAHVVGHIGEISPEGLKASKGSHRPGDLVGKVGVERVYEDYLGGTDGIQKISVNVKGEKVEELSTQPPRRGLDAVLTLDANLQRTAEDALQRGVELARRLIDPDSGTHLKGTGGAVVALDPKTGDILALASNPTFDPNWFVGDAPPGVLAGLNKPEAQFPMLNRAIAEAIPPASTFKVITAAAAWDAGMLRPNRTIEDPGFLRVGQQTFRDWKQGGHGRVDLRKSLVESVDVYYYQLGVELNGARPRIGEHLQAIARTFGLGTQSGVDLPGERSGLVPDAAWKEARFSQTRPVDRRWFPGDSANLSVGQGFLQVTPLQLAGAFSALVNGGTVHRPHVLRCLAELDASKPLPADQACENGMIPDAAKRGTIARPQVDANALEFMRAALAGVVREGGTAAAAFEGFPLDRIPVGGKTGTAQMKPRQDFSWFAGYAPVNDPQIVVVAMVEEAGAGAQIAAPIVRRTIEGFFGLPAGNFEAGARTD